MDYLVAARGYALALGSFTLAIYLFARTLAARTRLSDRQLLNNAAAISAFTALSFTANFSFAYANGFLLLAVFGTWMYYLIRRKRGPHVLVRLALACTLPALVVAFVIAGSVVAEFPRKELFYGTDSLIETWKTVYDASFSDLNPYLVNHY